MTLSLAVELKPFVTVVLAFSLSPPPPSPLSLLPPVRPLFPFLRTCRSPFHSSPLPSALVFHASLLDRAKQSTEGSGMLLSSQAQSVTSSTLHFTRYPSLPLPPFPCPPLPHPGRFPSLSVLLIHSWLSNEAEGARYLGAQLGRCR